VNDTGEGGIDIGRKYKGNRVCTDQQEAGNVSDISGRLGMWWWYTGPGWCK
jgi:hypothetical protein